MGRSLYHSITMTIPPSVLLVQGYINEEEPGNHLDALHEVLHPCPNAVGLDYFPSLDSWLRIIRILWV